MSDATSNPPGGFPTSLSSVSLSSESSSSMSSQVTGLRLRSEGNGGPSRRLPHQCSRSQPTRTPEGRPSSRTRRPRVRKRSRRQPQLHRLDEFLVQSGKERNVVHSGFDTWLTSQWIQVQSCPCCNSSAPAVSGEASQRAMKTTKKSKAAEATKTPRTTTIKNHSEAEGEAAASNQWPP